MMAQCVLARRKSLSSIAHYSSTLALSDFFLIFEFEFAGKMRGASFSGGEV
jgi:hypothetical protein